MSNRARRMKAFRRRLDAIYRKFTPKFKEGDVLVDKLHMKPSIKILAIVADQYKYDCGDEFPHYEFTHIIDNKYELV